MKKYLILIMLLTLSQADKITYNNIVVFDSNVTIDKNSTLYFTDKKSGEFCYCRNIKNKWVCKEMEDY